MASSPGRSHITTPHRVPDLASQDGSRPATKLVGVASTPFRYRSPDEDSARRLGFPIRDGDTVISTRSKTGTMWVQKEVR
jgi:hypothetical protein